MNIIFSDFKYNEMRNIRISQNSTGIFISHVLYIILFYNIAPHNHFTESSRVRGVTNKVEQ